MKQSKKINHTSKKNKLSYKTVFIDWNGTLSGSKFWGHLEKTDPKMFSTIENTLFGQLRGLLKPWMKGEIQSEDVIRRISDKSKLAYSDVFDEFIHSCMNMEFVSKDVPGLIKKLQKNGSKVVVATDNMDSFTRWTKRYLKIDDLFDDVLNSHYLGGMKKDVDKDGKSIFFSEYLKKNNLKPGESILVDDSSDDIQTIESFGIKYEHIEPVKGFVPALNRILASY